MDGGELVRIDSSVVAVSGGSDVVFAGNPFFPEGEVLRGVAEALRRGDIARVLEERGLDPSLLRIVGPEEAAVMLLAVPGIRGWGGRALLRAMIEGLPHVVENKNKLDDTLYAVLDDGVLVIGSTSLESDEGFARVGDYVKGWESEFLKFLDRFLFPVIREAWRGIRFGYPTSATFLREVARLMEGLATLGIPPELAYLFVRAATMPCMVEVYCDGSKMGVREYVPNEPPDPFNWPEFVVSGAEPFSVQVLSLYPRLWVARVWSPSQGARYFVRKPEIYVTNTLPHLLREMREWIARCVRGEEPSVASEEVARAVANALLSMDDRVTAESLLLQLVFLAGPWGFMPELSRLIEEIPEMKEMLYEALGRVAG